MGYGDQFNQPFQLLKTKSLKKKKGAPFPKHPF